MHREPAAETSADATVELPRVAVAFAPRRRRLDLGIRLVELAVIVGTCAWFVAHQLQTDRTRLAHDCQVEQNQHIGDPRAGVLDVCESTTVRVRGPAEDFHGGIPTPVPGTPTTR